MAVKFKDTNIFKIGSFLRKRKNKTFSVADISTNLNIQKKSVSSSLSRLKNGANVTKIINGRKRIVRKLNGKPRKRGYRGFRIGSVRNSSRGQWEFFERTNFKIWKVDFKLIATNNIKPKNKWDEKIMDLSGTATGIVPSNVSKTRVTEIAATELFRKSLDVMQSEGVILWQSVMEDDSKTVYLGSELINENPLDKVYNGRWDGKIYFVNNVKAKYQYPVSFNIEVSEYD